MKQVIINTDSKVIPEDDVHNNTPVFAKKNGRLCGMVVKDKEGWILKCGADFEGYGYHETRRACIEGGIRYGYTFHIED